MELDLDTSELATFSAASPVSSVDFNISDLTVFQVSEDTEVTALTDPVYEQFLADVWVGIVLTLMVLSCVCFMCSCLIYHKFQEWKHRGVETRNSANIEMGSPELELPSYTIASGLPTYEEALEQLKKAKDLQQGKAAVDNCPKHNTTTQEATRQEQTSDGSGNTLSVFNLFGIYQRSGESGSFKPS